jgi:predicted amidohydrolase
VTREPLPLAVAPPPTTAGDVSANVTAHAVLIRAAAARVVVFPEMSLTGYELDAPPLDPGDPRLAPLVDVCALTGTTALAGAPVDGPYIGVLAIDGSGVTVAYRKMNPGGGEPARFLAGTDPAVIEVDGWRIGLAVCRDTGLPDQAAATASLGMDVYAAGLADHPHEDVIQESRAQRVARDHGVWVAFASFAGPTGGGYPETAGRSGIWSPSGTVVARAGRTPGDFARAVLPPS